MMYDTELAAYYDSLYDEKIVQLAKEPKGLSDDAIQILKNQIRKRNLDNDLIQLIDLELAPISENERFRILDLIENSACPRCRKKESRLQGYKYHSTTCEHQIICKKCAKEIFRHSMISNLTTGWWYRNGISRMLFALISDLVNQFFKTKISNKIMDDFIDNNIGRIRNHEKIIHLLSEYNKAEN